MSKREFDYIVVGAGAAGCAVANRLSSSPDKSVLLIEAGADIRPGEEPASIRDAFPTAYTDPRYVWPGLLAENGPDPGPERSRVAMPFPQGCILGGSSSINGMVAMRGLPMDFNEWRSLGAEGWGWDDVLPFFKRLEKDLDYDGALHGQEGPMPIRRLRRKDWPLFPRSVGEALQTLGYRYFDDMHADEGDGFSPVPMNNLPDRRISAASAYLTAEVRQRANLQVLSASTVERLLFSGQRATGVAVRTPKGTEHFQGREIILSAGALFSPALLMRSGVGPAATLSRLGIPLVADRPGVGDNLQNHPVSTIGAYLPRHATQHSSVRPAHSLGLRYSSGHPDCPPGDMWLILANRTAWHPLGRHIGAIMACVHKPFSRGAVTLKDADPSSMPEVNVNLLSDARDFERMVGGLRLMLEVLAHPEVMANTSEVFMPGALMGHPINSPSAINFVKSFVAAIACELSPSLRRRLFADIVHDPKTLMRDDEFLRRTVTEESMGTGHVCGTCKIGPATDPTAVVDPSCRVYGVEGVRVADASVMPTVVSAPTHLTAIMIGEKVAEMARTPRKAA